MCMEVHADPTVSAFPEMLLALVLVILHVAKETATAIYVIHYIETTLADGMRAPLVLLANSKLQKVRVHDFLISELLANKAGCKC